MSAEMPFKFMSDNRRQVGDFEMIDLIDEHRIDSMRKTLQVDAPSHIQWNHSQVPKPPKILDVCIFF